MKRLLSTAVLLGVVLVSSLGCAAGKVTAPLEAADYNPLIDPAQFVSVIDNPFLPLVPGTTFTYEAETDEGRERTVTAVTDDTRTVMGVTCVVVWDRDFLNDELVEATYDWYAQDISGDVWYMGEDSKVYLHGMVVSTAGSWEAGVDGAKPGIIMKAHPVVDESYRQEFLVGVAEDMAKVQSLSASATVPYGSFSGCLQTLEWSRLDPGSLEQKIYAPGVGLVMETAPDEYGTGSKLISITTD